MNFALRFIFVSDTNSINNFATNWICGQLSGD